MTNAALAEILGVDDTYQTPRALVERGLRYSSVVRLAELYELTVSELCALLPVSQKTLGRYKEKPLSIDLSDHLVFLAEIYEQAVEVLGSREYALIWFKTPNYAFSYRRPLDLLRTFAGIKDITNELGRIQHGIFV